jgi:hypothetical protein
VWAGKGWGAFFWPRIGHEVVVVFEEGDPDQPLIIGSVYNAENMPWFELPKLNMFSGIKSSSVRGQAGKHYNGLVFVDKKDQEHLSIHSERHMVFNAEFDKTFRVGRHNGEQIPGARTLTVGRLPGGGSGGGGPNENLFPQPEPQAIMGMNSSVVFGGNYQVAVPLNFQVAVGSNIQVCLNPASFLDIFPVAALPTEAMAAALGSGFGGNMQLTLGTSANFVMGQIYDINLGPRRITIDVNSKTAVQSVALPMGILLFATVILFLVAYDLIHDDDGRALAVMAFQTLMQVLLTALMLTQNLYHRVDAETKKAVEIGYVGAETTKSSETPLLTGLIETAAIVTLFELPALLDSAGEMQLDATNSSTTLGAGQTAQPPPPGQK